MTRLDRTALSFIIGIALILAAIILIGNHLPVTISCINENGCESISPYAVLHFEFSRPVTPEQLEAAWWTDPEASGTWTWTDSMHATWRLDAALLPGRVFHFGFIKAEIGENGETTPSESTWESVIRESQILFLRKFDNGYDLFSINPENIQEISQITNTNGKLIAYNPSHDGEKIAYAQFNDSNGIDFWVTDRSGQSPALLLNCGSDRCTTPVWAPDDNRIIYTRENAIFAPQPQYGAPRPYILDLNTGQTNPLFDDDQHIGYGATWSPDGNWIAIWNGIAGGIEVVNVQTGDTRLLPSSSGEPGTWSPDSRYLAYTNIISTEAGYQEKLFLADLSNGTIATIGGGNLDTVGFSYNSADFSPSGKYLAVTIQPNNNIPGRELWIFTPGGSPIMAVSNDLSVFLSQVEWSQDGNSLLFLTFDYSSNEDGNNLLIWHTDQSEAPQTLVKDVYFPHWIP